jgi:hypothetical protein
MRTRVAGAAVPFLSLYFYRSWFGEIVGHEKAGLIVRRSAFRSGVFLLLFRFQGEGVDIAGRYVVKHERRVGGVQPEP